MENNLDNINNVTLKEVKFWQGTKLEYDELISINGIDEDTIYFILSNINEGGNILYLGTKLINDYLFANSGSSDIDEESVKKIIQVELKPVNDELDKLSEEITNINNNIITYIEVLVNEYITSAISNGLFNSSIETIAEPIIIRLVGEAFEPINVMVNELKTTTDNLSSNITTLTTKVDKNTSDISSILININDIILSEVNNIVTDKKISDIATPIINEKVDLVIGDLTNDINETNNLVKSFIVWGEGATYVEKNP